MQAPVPHFVAVRDQPSPDETNDTERGDAVEEAVAAPAGGAERESNTAQNEVPSETIAVATFVDRCMLDLLVILSVRVHIHYRFEKRSAG
jgi:hypothetical protein